MSNRVVVVGASLAGLRCIEGLRREGFDGGIVAVGAEAEPPYNRPPLSKQFLVDGWTEDRLALARNGIEAVDAQWRLGRRAAALDPDALVVTLDDGGTVEGDVVVIATGARARQLPFGDGLEGVTELRTLADARVLRAAIERGGRFVVVGAGFIGMEVAASLRRLGIEVDVVEPLEAPLMRGLGRVLGERVAKRHRAEGVRFHLGLGVEGFEGVDRVEGVRLSNGETLAADAVVVGVGSLPDVEWLEGAGLEIDGGVLCDATGASSRKGVFALGDCARWENRHYPDRPRFEHWTSAVEQADVVARRIAHGGAEPFAPIPYVWTDQYDLRVAIAGEPRDGDEMRVTQGRLEDDCFLALFRRDDCLAAAVGFKRPGPLLTARRRMAEGISWKEALDEFG